MALVPKVQWAQRKDKLYVTIDLQDVLEPKVDISNDAEGKFGRVAFKGIGRSHATGVEKHEYSLDLELFKAVKPDESKISTSDRSIVLVIIKADDAQEHWPRLLKSPGKVTNITVDWNKWVDEDEEEEGKDDIDLGALQNLQSFGGGAFGGGLGGGLSGLGNVEAVDDDEDDSDDDEDMPPLEEVKDKHES